MKKSLSLAVLAVVNLTILFTASSGNAADFGYADLVYLRDDCKDASLLGGKAQLDGFSVALSYEYSPYQVAADLSPGASLSLFDGVGLVVFLRKDLS